MGMATPERHWRSAAAKAGSLHFEVLDSWRGICAVLIALAHFPAAGLSQSAFISSAYLFVDFFFVLSGFVITARYRNEVVTLDDAGRLALERFGRLYPLHLFMLVVFVGFDLVRLAWPHMDAAAATPFIGEDSLPNLVLNTLLLQGLGFAHGPSWNVPSWSISVLFATYLAFAAVLALAGQRAWVGFLLVALGAPLALIATGVTNMNLTFDLGLVRCLFGFSVGALVAWFGLGSITADRTAISDGRDRHLWTMAEVMMIAAIVLFVGGAGPGALSIASPLVFALLIYLFAHEGGAVSDALKGRWMLMLGALSYSIYMVHWFVQARLYDLAALADQRYQFDWIGLVRHNGETISGFGPHSSVVALAATVAMIGVVLVVAYLTWRFVEMPALGHFKRLAQRSSPVRKHIVAPPSLSPTIR